MATKHVITRTVILSFTQALSRILSFVFSIIIARYFGGNLFGKFTYIFTLIIILSFIIDFGLSSLIVREISQDKSKTSLYLSSSIIIKMTLSFIAYSGLLIYSVYQTDVVKSHFIIFLGLFLFVKSLFDTVLCYFQAYERQDIFGYLQVINNSILCLIAGLIVLFKANVLYLGVTHVIAGIISTVFAIYLVNRLSQIRFQVSIATINLLIKTTIPFGLTLFITVAYARMGILMLSWFRSDIEVGYYGAAYKLIEGLLLIPMVISKIVYPILSKNRSKMLVFNQIATDSIRYLLVISSLVTFLCILYSEKIINFVFTTDYNSSVLIFKILLLSLPISFPNYILGFSLFSLHKQHRALIVAIATFLVNVLLNIYYTPIYGMAGVAIITIITVITSFIGYIWYLKKEIDVNAIILITIKSVLICVILIYLNMHLLKNYSIIFIGLVSFILYILLSILLKLIKYDEIKYIKDLINR